MLDYSPTDLISNRTNKATEDASQLLALEECFTGNV